MQFIWNYLIIQKTGDSIITETLSLYTFLLIKIPKIVKLNWTLLLQLSSDLSVGINWYITPFVMCCSHPSWYEDKTSTSQHVPEHWVVWRKGSISLLNVKPFLCTWPKTFRFVCFNSLFESDHETVLKW